MVEDRRDKRIGAPIETNRYKKVKVDAISLSIVEERFSQTISPSLH